MGEQREVRIRSAAPGRARFVVPGLYRAPDLARRLEGELRDLRGVVGARASTRTGSVLVLFAGEADLAGIRRAIEGLAGLPSRPPGHAPGPPPAGRLAANVAQVLPHGLVAALDRRLPSDVGAAARRALREGGATVAAVVVRVPLVGARAGASLSGLLRRAGAAFSAGGGEAPAPAARAPEEERLWHVLDEGEVLRLVELASADDGLDPAEAARRLDRVGPNVLPTLRPRSNLELILDQLKSVPVLLLFGSAALSLATGGVADAVVILAVIGINAAIGFTTERATERTIRALEEGGAIEAVVVRGGVERRVPAEALVPGDVIRLVPGTAIPADARLLRLEQLSVDESSLTGESLPVHKDPETIPDPLRPLGDRRNLVFRGTLVTGGNGLAVVVATGGATEIGRIQRLIGEVRPPETTMQRQLRVLGRDLVIAAGIACAGVFVVGLLRGRGTVEMLRTAVSLAVAAVPEGLPTMATTALALGIHRMEARGVLVRHLGAIENLGAVGHACLDKTGTITLNRMSAVRVAVAAGGLELSGGAFRDGDAEVDPLAVVGMEELLRCVALCSDTELEGVNGSLVLHGTPTENALVQAALDAGVDVEGERRALPRVAVAHRTETRRTMRTVHRRDDGRFLVLVKGRPEEVLATCTELLAGDGVRPLAEADRRAVEAENERMAGRALRVLGAAFAVRDEPPSNGEGDLVWLGLAGLADPPREGVRELMAEFHRAGIDTAMITGDQSATAYAVAREIGLARNGELELLDASRIEELDPEVLQALSSRVHVFSRVSPARKLQIVQALQRAGRVVAMTGDGINDGPALRAADVGIAMGAGGTEAARQTADVILREDDLATILEGIRMGRTIGDDIRKAVRFLLATNFSEIVVTFSAIAVGLAEPLTPVQLLWLNLVTDIFPELALAVEPPEADVMSRPPRDPAAPLFTRRELVGIGGQGALLAGAGLAAYAYGLARYGGGPRASTLAFMGLTSAQLLHAISARSETHGVFERDHLPPNPYLPLAVGGGLALQVLTGLLPGVRSLLGTSRLSLGDWAVGMGLAVAPFLITEGRRWLGHPRPALPEPAGLPVPA